MKNYVVKVTTVFPDTKSLLEADIHSFEKFAIDFVDLLSYFSLPVFSFSPDKHVTWGSPIGRTRFDASYTSFIFESTHFSVRRCFLAYSLARPVNLQHLSMGLPQGASLSWETENMDELKAPIRHRQHRSRTSQKNRYQLPGLRIRENGRHLNVMIFLN